MSGCFVHARCRRGLKHQSEWFRRVNETGAAGMAASLPAGDCLKMKGGRLLSGRSSRLRARNGVETSPRLVESDAGVSRFAPDETTNQSLIPGIHLDGAQTRWLCSNLWPTCLPCSTTVWAESAARLAAGASTINTTFERISPPQMPAPGLLLQRPPSR